MNLRILHTNDFHGKLEGARFQRLKELREQVDLYFDSGDAIKAGNLSLPLLPEAVWPRLKELRCTASCPGNRESHPLVAGFQAKVAGLKHPMLCANVRYRDGRMAVTDRLKLDVGGVRVGVFGVMVPIVTARMASAAVSAYLWTDPVEATRRMVQALRPEVDVLVALTHIGHPKDLELVRAVPGIDLLFGGHSHTVLERPVQENGTWIAQGGSHGRFAGAYAWDGRELAGGLVALPT